MAKEEFEIEIRPNGQVSVRTIGIKGHDCVDAAKEFIEMIQGKVVASEKTNEYYETGINATVQDENSLYNRWG
ncbi:MAG: DUF2997 domain-containing protein [Planctomycetia bacterium]|nr:DUF2997 domain-containing protein [Planctomycetia bacterium]